jgi:hypothetical protein
LATTPWLENIEPQRFEPTIKYDFAMVDAWFWVDGADDDAVRTKKNRASFHGPCLLGESVSFYVKFYFLFSVRNDSLLLYIGGCRKNFSLWWPWAF